MTSGRIGALQYHFSAAMCHAELCLTQKSKCQSVHLPLHLRLKVCKRVWFEKDKDLYCTCLIKKRNVYITLKYMIPGKDNKGCSWKPLQKTNKTKKFKKIKPKQTPRSGLSFKELLKNQTSLTTIRQFFCLYVIPIWCPVPFCHAF